MLFGYTGEELGTLVLMVLSGAGKTICVDVYYKLGIDDPILATLLFLFGNAVVLPIYFCYDRLFVVRSNNNNKGKGAPSGDDNNGRKLPQRNAARSTMYFTDSEMDEEEEAEEDNYGINVETSRNSMSNSSIDDKEGVAIVRMSEPASAAFHIDIDGMIEADGIVGPNSAEDCDGSESTNSFTSSRSTLKGSGDDEPGGNRATTAAANRSSGSVTGLTLKSFQVVQWVHKIPFWLKPLFPGVFLLLDAGCRYASLLYLEASISEMIITGLEVALSVVVAKIVRKREVSIRRWQGVAVILAGLMVVSASGIAFNGGDSTTGTVENRSTKDYMIGLVFALGKVVMAVAEGMSMELFLQEAEFPPLQLVGMTGCYGLLVGIPLYFVIGPMFGQNPIELIQMIGESTVTIWFTFFLVTVFLSATLFSALAIAVTSSMTRNMWGTLRGLVVMFASLGIFYAASAVGSNKRGFGEEWLVPRSPVILVGYGITLVGLRVYYIGRIRPSAAESIQSN